MSEAMTQTKWYQVSNLDDLWEGDMAAVDVEGTQVLLINVDGDVYAYRDQCPHQEWPLHDGDFSDGVLMCLQHQWTFDPATGKGLNPSTCQLHKFECVVDGEGNIHVSLG